jgi:hypothetical protein
MVARRLFIVHVIVFLAVTLPLMGVGVGLFIAGLKSFADGTMSFSIIPWIIAALVGAGPLAHFLIDLLEPNRNMQSNREAAWALIKRNVMRVGQVGDKFAQPEPATGHGWWRLGKMGITLAVFLLNPACELLRMVNGWPMNDHCVPCIVAPGDQVTVYFPEAITSVNGYWRAEGQAEILNAHDLGIAPELKLSSNNDNWPRVIVPAQNEAHNYQRLWGRIDLPEEPKLAGRNLQIKMDLQVIYPAKPISFENSRKDVSQTINLALTANREAALVYTITYSVGGSVAVALGLGMSFALLLRAKWQRSKGLPTEMHFSE